MIMHRSGKYTTALLLLAGAGCTTLHRVSNPSTGASSKSSDWQPLFDGQTMAGWRGFHENTVPKGWHIVDGTLVFEPGDGDLITVNQYENFELELEWNVSSGGNSGIFFHVSEDGTGSMGSASPEFQVLDDAKHPDGQSRLTSAGALYALYESPSGIVHPAGEWNAVRILVQGPHVEEWLNGAKIVDCDMWSDDWNRRVKASKFAQVPGYGLTHKGYIGLQDHHDRVAYRNIRIRVLP